MRKLKGSTILILVCAACSSEPQLGRSVRDGVEMQGVEMQGVEMQGTSLAGASVEGFQYASFTLHGNAITNVHLEGGGIVGQQGITWSGWAASLSTCGLLAPIGPDRNCGWRVESVGSCKPGTTVAVGAAAACGLGSCTGDAMLRVCAGTSPCDSGSSAVLDASDNACGSLCPLASFPCPAGGLYTVMSASSNALLGATVTPQSSAGLLPAARTLQGADLVGARFTGVTYPTASAGAITFQARIKRVDGPLGCFDPTCQHQDDTSSTYLYSVEFLDPDPQDEGNWYPLCAPWVVDNLPPDYRAVAVAGEWNQQGDRVESSTNFTLGCRSGVIAKCITWGYRPWDPPSDLTNPNEFVDLHQACTRMARADYCGDGTPHTMDGTSIFEWDDVGIQQPPGDDSPGWPFEAAWSEAGAICMSHERWAALGAGTGLCPTIRRTPVTCIDVAGQEVCTPNICETVSDAIVVAHTLTPALDVHLYDASLIH